MNILGISALYHDSAAALLVDGKVAAAAQEERFTRKRHDSDFPFQAIEYCLKEAGLRASRIDHVVFYDKPFSKFERLLETYLAAAPAGFRFFKTSFLAWIQEKLFQKSLLIKELRKLDSEVEWEKRLLFSEHHLSHAASAFYPSPFDEAVILTMDGVGEWTTTSLAVGRGNRIEVLKEIQFPHSLGLLYSAFTGYLGFKVNSGEYKVMGLAPYGRPTYVDTIYQNLIDVKPDGSFRLNMKYFEFCKDLRMTNRRFERLFGGPARRSEELLTQREMDIAASLQAVTEDIVAKLCATASRETGIKNLCLAGGVALNCVANGKVWREGPYEKIWVQPAAGDAGGALGAAYEAHYLLADAKRTAAPRDAMQGAYLGPEFTQAEIENRLRVLGAKFETLEDAAFFDACAADLEAGKAVGWFQGRMEFGPRALGNRSILGDARNRDMQTALNLKVKYRESFRPFAPSVLAEDVGEWFDYDDDSPYMLMVAPVKNQHRLPTSPEQEALFGIDKLKVPRSSVPAVTHVDYSARLQTVHADTNPRYHALIRRFKERTGCPLVVNTSFNIRGEPIVCTPDDAFRCFMGTDIETLAIGNCIVRKDRQDAQLKRDYRNQFELD